MDKDADYKAELNRQMRSLARRSRSIAEVRARLIKRDVLENTAEALIADLIKSGFLDDRRYAAEYSRSKLRLGFGRLRIRRELLERGVPGSFVDDALRNEETDFPEEELLRSTLAKRLRNVGEPTTPGQLKNLVNFLQRRGFRSDSIRNELDALFDKIFSGS